MNPVSTQESQPAPTPNVGSLARIALPELLKRIALSELSGCLEVTAARIVRTIYFDRGFVVFTASSDERDRLGQCLLEAGRITQRELDLAARLMKGNRRIGQAIVEAGFLTEEELGRELARQARRICASLYGLNEGMYRFEEGECPIPLELRLSLSIYRIQLEGIRSMRNGKLIGAALPSLKSEVQIAQIPPFSFEDVRFLPVELLVMEAAQKKRSLQGIVDRVGKKRGIVLRSIYGLLSAGIIQEMNGEVPQQALKVQEETGTFLLSKLDKGKGDEEAQNVRQEVLLAFENTEHAAATDLLNVDPEAPEEEIRRAYVTQQERWDNKQKELENEKSLFIKVDEIKRRLEAAKAKLLEEKQGAEPAPPPEEPTSNQVASFRSEKDKDEVKRLLKEVKLRQMVNDREGVISFLYEVVKLSPGNAKFEAMLAQALSAHPVMKKKAERHFRQAISLDPQNAEFHYLLGRYYQSFDMRSRALAEFKTALRIEPTLAKARSALVELKGEDTSLQGKIKQLFG